MCMSEGGSVQSSSFTGPAGEDLGHLQPVEEEPDMRGADNYSISVVRTGGTHGDTFQCMASNGASTATAIFTLSGLSYILLLHALVSLVIRIATQHLCLSDDKQVVLWKLKY